MNKKLFLLFATLLFSSICFCQNNKDSLSNINKKLKIALRIGANISYFSNEIGPYPRRGFDNSFRVASNLSVRLEYALPKQFYLNTGLQFGTRGGNFRKRNNEVILIGDQGTQNAFDVKIYRLDYFEIPLQVGYNVRKIFDKNYTNSSSPILFSVGLVPGFNVKSDLRENFFSKGGGFGLVDADENFTNTQFDFAKNFLFSGLIELSFVTYQSKLGDFILHFSYSNTFTDVYVIDSLEGYNYKTKTGTFSLSFGFKFD